MKRPLAATRLLFALEGFSMGCWGAHVPSVKRQFGLDEAQLSWVLLAGVLGALLSLAVAGRAVARFGAAPVVRGAGLLMAASLAGLLAPAGFAALMLVVALLGFGATLADVAINAEGAVLEAQSGRKLMSGLHGMFSLGGMLGAGAVALLLALGWAPATQLPLLGALVAGLLLPAAGWMLPAHPPQPAEHARWRWPHGQLALLGGLATLGMLAEGAMYDWSALYLQTEAGAAPALAALAFAAFSGAMAATRFAGDRLRERFAPGMLLGGGALLAAAGLALVLLLPHPGVGLLGFAVVGMGLANVVPLLFIGAAQLPGVSPAQGIASVAALGFFGFLAGPPLIGAVAHASSLRGGLSLVLVSALLLALAARRLP
jgi:fucose permease